MSQQNVMARCADCRCFVAPQNVVCRDGEWICAPQTQAGCAMRREEARRMVAELEEWGRQGEVTP